MVPTPPGSPRCSPAGGSCAAWLRPRACRPGPARRLPRSASAECRAAVAHEVLGAGQHRERIRAIVALEAPHRRLAQLRHQVRIFAEALVGAAPADILRHRDARREGPLDSGGAHLLGGDAARPSPPAPHRACSPARCCAGKPPRRSRCCGRAPRRLRTATESSAACSSCGPERS